MEKFRRVVTGHDASGRSKILFDGPPTQILMDSVAELWFTDETPADNSGAEDTTDRPPSMFPPKGGTIFRYIEVPPESGTETAKAKMDESLEVLNAAAARVDTSRHPGMHRTPTIDYVVVLRGEVTMLLDEGEVHLKPFDLVVQRGTNHAWVNKGKVPAILLAANIDAKPL